MKAYIYTPEQVGLTAWPPGELRLNVEQVTDPDQADIFLYPGAFHTVTLSQLNALPYIGDYAERHVFFHCSDHELIYNKPCLFIRCNTRPWDFKGDSNTI